MSGRVAYLVLADGLVLQGETLGAEGIAVGEVVFTTGMTGYQEVLTDPSYHGQIVTMTAAHIGNTGIVPEDAESIDDRPRVAGFLVNDASDEPSNWRSTESLHTYLARHGVVGLSGVDTRTLTRHLRDHGAQNGAIGTGDPGKLLAAARAARSMVGLDLVREVTPREPYTFTEGRGVWSHRPKPEPTRHVVAIDCGLKRNILRCLVDVGCRLTVVPATTSAKAILAMKPDGVFLSNGPGDPAAVPYVIETIRGLLGKTPLFGICLGHQMLALALGATTYKLKFGHRGCNQPVIDLTTGRVEITTQNHGFAVDLHSLAGKAETTHLHLNDRTSEGLTVPSLRAFSVQYHPEAAAGPHDSMYLFDRFVTLMGAELTLTIAVGTWMHP
ncbi:MAG: glutamine-hydrolyzing carbamoyl-phosphate synthase small subunit [Myxococcales bacterium]|nr:glutamine-hydrolyzing carbamoyl-phosphate synthase small subunit [Polyangiaceae bacterium]MDW8251287.1 glutamine-hydrolyzing carbamoyl-phosphate synthase small subunit [Myxococcales bacterium]